MQRTTNLKRAVWLTVVVVGAAGLLAARADALEVAGVGGRLGVSSPDDASSTTELGVHAQLAQPGTRVSVLPSVMYWRSDDVRDVNPSVDLTYRFDPARRVHPYVGGGLGLNFVDDQRFGQASTDAGMNLLGGVTFPGDRHDLFIEARHTVSDVSRTAILAGVTFRAP